MQIVMHKACTQDANMKARSHVAVQGCPCASCLGYLSAQTKPGTWQWRPHQHLNELPRLCHRHPRSLLKWGYACLKSLNNLTSTSLRHGLSLPASLWWSHGRQSDLRICSSKSGWILFKPLASQHMIKIWMLGSWMLNHHYRLQCSQAHFNPDHMHTPRRGAPSPSDGSGSKFVLNLESKSKPNPEESVWCVEQDKLQNKRWASWRVIALCIWLRSRPHIVHWQVC